MITSPPFSGSKHPASCWFLACLPFNPVDVGDMFFWNIGRLLLNYMALQPIRSHSQSLLWKPQIQNNSVIHFITSILKTDVMLVITSLHHLAVTANNSCWQIKDSFVLAGRWRAMLVTSGVNTLFKIYLNICQYSDGPFSVSNIMVNVDRPESLKTKRKNPEWAWVFPYSYHCKPCGDIINWSKWTS
jgi:hypothetical protein